MPQLLICHIKLRVHLNRGLQASSIHLNHEGSENKINMKFDIAI